MSAILFQDVAAAEVAAALIRFTGGSAVVVYQHDLPAGCDTFEAMNGVALFAPAQPAPKPIRRLGSGIPTPEGLERALAAIDLAFGRGVAA